MIFFHLVWPAAATRLLLSASAAAATTRRRAAQSGAALLDADGPARAHTATAATPRADHWLVLRTAAAAAAAAASASSEPRTCTDIHT